MWIGVGVLFANGLSSGAFPIHRGRKGYKSVRQHLYDVMRSVDSTVSDRVVHGRSLQCLYRCSRWPGGLFFLSARRQ